MRFDNGGGGAVRNLDDVARGDRAVLAFRRDEHQLHRRIDIAVQGEMSAIFRQRRIQGKQRIVRLDA
jgi:hypothetical protein